MNYTQQRLVFFFRKQVKESMRYLDKGDVQLVYQHLLPKLVRPIPT